MKSTTKGTFEVRFVTRDGANYKQRELTYTLHRLDGSTVTVTELVETYLGAENS